MSKSIHFSGQPLYGQVIKLLNKSTILQISSKHGGEHYVKRFDCWTHLVVMLYAVIMRFDSLREITASLQAEARKLCHLGITTMPSRCTISDANKRRPEVIFESIYRDLYATYRHVLSSDSRKNKDAVWMKRLQIIDSTTITLFSNLLFKGVGRHPKTGKKKGGGINPNRSLEIFASKCKTVTFIMTQIYIAHLNYCHNHDVFHAK